MFSSNYTIVVFKWRKPLYEFLKRHMGHVLDIPPIRKCQSKIKFDASLSFIGLNFKFLNRCLSGHFIFT